MNFLSKIDIRFLSAFLPAPNRSKFVHILPMIVTPSAVMPRNAYLSARMCVYVEIDGSVGRKRHNSVDREEFHHCECDSLRVSYPPNAKIYIYSLPRSSYFLPNFVVFSTDRSMRKANKETQYLRDNRRGPCYVRDIER